MIRFVEYSLHKFTHKVQYDRLQVDEIKSRKIGYNEF